MAFKAFEGLRNDRVRAGSEENLDGARSNQLLRIEGPAVRLMLVP